MVSLIIEISDDLHRKLKVKSANDDISLKDMVTPILEKLVKDDKR